MPLLPLLGASPALASRPSRSGGSEVWRQPVDTSRPPGVWAPRSSAPTASSSGRTASSSGVASQLPRSDSWQRLI
eukprot:13447474-Heterocapsa_arctica.AAC.1